MQVRTFSWGLLVLGWITAASVQAQLRITEAMSSSGAGGTPDWFELSNLGTNSVDISGWRMDDNSFSFAGAATLNGVTYIAGGESVVFIEDSTTNNVAAFKSYWGGMTNRQVGTYSGSVGLSSTGDGVVVFHSSGTEINRVSFGAATTGSSFTWVYDSSGTLLSATTGVVSSAGTDGAYNSTTNSSYTIINTASPGTRASALSLAFTSSGEKFARVGTNYTYNVTYQKRLSTDPNPTLSAVTKPTWLNVSGMTVSGTPGTNNTGPNQAITLRLTSVIGGVTNTVDQSYTITVFNTQPKVVLNEYNAVGGANLHASLSGDLRLGRIEGNGGDWFELVVRGTGFGTTVDMRGWKIQVSQVTGGARLTDTITLSQDSFWAAVPAGMILTFTEDNLAEGGYDTALNAENRLSTAKYAWSNIWLGDTALVASVTGDSTSGIGSTTSGINISGDDTQIAVLNAGNGYEFGPLGEGIWRYPEVNSTSNFYLAIDPGGVVDPTLVQADPRYSAIYFGKDPVVVSTFGLPNIGSAGIQPFFGVNPPYFATRPWRFAREGQTTAAAADFRQNESHGMTFQVRGKAGGTVPTWLTVTAGDVYADIDLAPAVGDAGIYELELVLTDTSNSAQTVEPYTVVVLPATSEVLVNEFNAVSSPKQINGGVIPVPADGDGVDTYFGTVDGNGGDWLELVVVGNGSAGTTDLRGWKIEIDEGAGTKFLADDVIVLSQDSYWAAVPNGTILTITEKTTAEGGLDTWIHKVNRLGQAGGSGLNDGGYAWSNIHYLDSTYIDQAASSVGDGLGISSNNTQIRILKPRSGVAGQFDVVAGPVGEGVQPLSGVNNTEVLELEVDPAPTVSPYLPDVVTDSTVVIYDDGNGSTFGSPNRFTGGTQAQNFGAYRTPNSAPTFANSPMRDVEAGAAYSFHAATADAEGQGVTVSVTQKPSWLNFSGGVLSGTAGAGGVYPVELVATDSAGATTTLKYQLTVIESAPYDVTFGSWASAAGQGSIALNSDADGNGLTALLEYAYGAASPGSISRSLLPASSTTNSGGTSQLVLTYFTRTSGVTMAPEVNTSLGTNGWGTNGVSNTLVGTVATNNTTLEQRRASVSIDNTNSRKFLRLKVTSP